MDRAQQDRIVTTRYPVLMGKRGFGHVYLRGKVWWVKYYVGGAARYKSSKSERKADAVEMLKHLLVSKHAPARMDRVTVGELLQDALEFYRTERPRSYDDFARPVAKALSAYFGKHRAAQVTTTQLRAYRAQRKASGKADATVNREMAFLRRAFNLALKESKKVREVPAFPMVAENNARKGFLDHDGYLRLLEELPSELKPLLVVAYHIGCRRGELLTTMLDQVDLARRRIHLFGDQTKNSEPRSAPIYGDMIETLERHIAETRARFPGCRWLFNRNGNRIIDFRKSWEDACERAGLKGLLFHDLRRSAVRNMVRAGIPETVARKISGHKTREIFERYNIVDDRDLTDAADKLETYLKGKL
jgi:integrase